MTKTPAKWVYGNEINFVAPNRSVDTIFLHCSASDIASHDDISVIKDWHMKGNNWSRVGYHFFINKSGDIQEGCPIEKIPIAQKGHNTGSIAICLHGLKKDNFTSEQLDSVTKLCKAITGAYSEKIRIRGHKEVSPKSCPVFDYQATLGLGEDGYYATTPTTNPTTETTANTMQSSTKIKAIRLMDDGPQVEALQSLLNKLGYPCTTDGDYGQNTLTKVKAFQKSKSLDADGIVGGKSVDKMFSGDSLILKKTQKGDDVLVLQLMLAMFGNSITHDGAFGPGTEKILKRQQQLIGLDADGVFGGGSRKVMLGL